MWCESGVRNSILEKINKPIGKERASKRISYIIHVLSSIANDIGKYNSEDKESIAEFTVKILYILLDLCDNRTNKATFNYSSINKYILKFSWKYFYIPMISLFKEDVMINNEDSSNYDALGIYYILCKNKNFCFGNDEKDKISRIYDHTSLNVKAKLNDLFLLNRYEGFELKNNYLEIDYIIYYKQFPLSLAMKPMDESVYGSLIITSCWDDTQIFQDHLNSIKLHILTTAYSSGMPIDKANKAINLFVYGLKFIKSSKLNFALKIFTELFESGFVKGISMKLLGLIYISMGKYEESCHFIRIGLKYFKYSKSFYMYFLSLQFYIERLVGISSLCPFYKINISSFVQSKQITILSLKENLSILPIENKLFINNFFLNNNLLYYQDRIYCDLVFKYSNIYLSRNDFYTKIITVASFFKNYTILYFYENTQNNCLSCVNIGKDINEIVIKNDFKAFYNTFRDIQEKSIYTLKFCMDDPSLWWRNRIELDCELKDLFTSTNLFEKGDYIINKKIILLIEPKLHSIPIELFFNKADCFRVFNIDHLFGIMDHRLNKNDISTNIQPFDYSGNDSNIKRKDGSFYLLDPENNLNSTRKTIKSFLDNRNITNGVTGRPLNEQEISEIDNFRSFMFFGHGNGIKYFKRDKLLNERIYLFGCSSLKMKYYNNVDTLNGVVKKLSTYRNLILGALWTVTDRDLDKFTISFLDGNCKCQNQDESKLFNISHHRNKCKLKYINGGAIVAYGLP